MNTRLLSTLFLSALSLTQLSHAQISPDLAQGLSPYAVYQAGAIDNVNPASGNLFLQIPLISYPQRGGDLRLSFYIFSNDKQWYISDYNGSCGVGSNQTCGSWAGANFIQGDTTQPAVGAYVARDQMVVFGWDDAKTVTQVAGCSPPGCAVTTDLYGFYVKSADGAKHYIGDQQNQTCTMGSCTVPLYSNIRNRYPAVDGSGFTPVTVPDFGPGGEVVDINGTHYTPTTVTDRNGNFITSSNSGWTDTLSRPIPGSAAGPGSQLSPTEPIPGVPSANALGHCPSGTISGREWDVPASLGYHSGTASYYLCYSNFNYSTNFDLNGTFGVTYYNVPESSSTDPNNIPALLLSAVVLPNGTQYTFSYEQQDLSLSQITLPTGGTISYEWQNIPFNLSTTAPISRALKKRTVSPGGGQPQQVWTYYWHKTLTTTPPYVPVYPIISVVTDPEGNDQERTLGGKDDAGNQTYQSLTPTKVQFYQGCGPDNDSPTKRCSPGAGTLLKTESYILGVYGSNGADVPTPPEQSALVYKPTTTTTTWGGVRGA